MSTDVTNEYDNDRTVDVRTHNEEPATRHDINEGGTIGAVGGAIVGAVAGGPIGAVIGAIAGGVASAGAVGVVDKHDNDYQRTRDHENRSGDGTTEVYPGRLPADNDYGNTDVTDTDITDADNTADRGYVGTGSRADRVDSAGLGTV